VATVAESDISDFGGKRTRLGAADVHYRDDVLFLLAHFPWVNAVLVFS
jgi:hypothetical protein